MNLTNREINKTAQDRQLEVQKNMLRQQTIQNSINADLFHRNKITCR